MRRLERPEEPAALAWARETGLGSRSPAEAWEGFADRGAVRDALLAAQDGHCAYCESRIGEHACHIDHHRPKRAQPNLTFVWENLLLSCDGRDCCGTAKGGIDCPDLLDPYRDPTDAWLVYVSDGHVVARENLDADTKRRVEESIRRLGLCCDRLVRKRREIISAWQGQFAQMTGPMELEHFWSAGARMGFPTARAQALERAGVRPGRGV